MDVNPFNQQANDMPTLPGFDHVRRFWMPKQQCFGVKVVAGDYYVSEQQELITTVLGSCVSACVRDHQRGIGGINHFLLPDSSCDILSSSNRYGVFAMEQLFNAIIKHGGRRENFEIKLVGGGNMIGGMNDIGRSNIAFVKNFMATEGFAIAAEDLGGHYPRKILYSPITGKLLVNKLKDKVQDHDLEFEIAAQRSKYDQCNNDDIELFD